MIKLLTRILKMTNQLYEENRLYKRLNLCLIKDNDNAFQRNLKAVEYIDENLKILSNFPSDALKLTAVIRECQEVRKILTTFKTENILDEVNGGKNENNNL